MADDTRTCEEVQAEQDASGRRRQRIPESDGYAEWVRAETEEAIRGREQPKAVSYTQEEIELETDLQRRSWCRR